MIKSLKILPTSLVSHSDLQRFELQYTAKSSGHLFLDVLVSGQVIVSKMNVAFTCGKGRSFIMLPVQKQRVNSEWRFFDQDQNLVYSCEFELTIPREWTLYFMISSHTDIGLHNSQYIQRANSVKFIDKAVSLIEQTRSEADSDRYKYIMEGTWFFNNYVLDKGRSKTTKIVENYIKKGDLGVCCLYAGSTFQTFGLEELCRISCERKKLLDEWGIDCKTMSMIDNNGLPLSIIQPFSDAGIENIIFSPNQWNPKQSTVWDIDFEDDTYPWNPNAGGSGARIDFRYDSELPMVFFWEDKNGNRLLVSGSTQYDNSGVPFGIFNKPQPQLINKESDYISLTEIKTGRMLRLLEQKYDFNLWLLPCYSDDQEPNLWLEKRIKEWNKKWKFPNFAIIGNPNVPFNILRQKYSDKIPVVKGDITGGWYQIHQGVSNLSMKKHQADRLLPIAEKYSTVACMFDKNYCYDIKGFNRAWNNLFSNDEHSYGASTYRGRKVHETWLQHKDWINKTYDFANTQIDNAIKNISSQIDCNSPSVVVFNPTNNVRNECVINDDGTKYKNVTLPKFGYLVIEQSEFNENQVEVQNYDYPPSVQNEFYKLTFNKNGSIKSIFDVQLGRELLSHNADYCANEVIYTKDNHKSFYTQNNTTNFCVIKDCTGVTVKTTTVHERLGAEIEQTVTLLKGQKQINVTNKILHANDMYNFVKEKTYYRYLYTAFPFEVDRCKRLVHLNGALIEYAKDVSGHCTDVYASMHDYCVVENDSFGVALICKTQQLVEFDHIHADKSDFGNAGKGSSVFLYLANDWVQMHVSGGCDLNYEFSYAVTSYSGGYEKAKIMLKAENFVTPIQTVQLQSQKGKLTEKQHTFIDFNTNSQFLTLKPSNDNKGIIARFYGEEQEGVLDGIWQKVTIDERERNALVKNGFYTYKSNNFKVKCKKINDSARTLDVGSRYTGLIDKPLGTNGEKDGQIYLIWGAVKDKNLSHYELYRSLTRNFKANKKTFVANVIKEPFVVARYEDCGLKQNTIYYYKVRAVSKDGKKGNFSEEFSAKTKEHIIED